MNKIIKQPRRRRGIPTLFAGTLFRSRHEATWAAFLTGIDLAWDYEPLDLAGYIPDFLIKYEKRPLLLEIKPADEDFESAKLKIECSGWENDVAIVTDGSKNRIGWMRDDGCWDRCVIVGCECGKPSIISESGRHECRNCGAGKRALTMHFRTADSWAEAKNKTQWNPVELAPE